MTDFLMQEFNLAEAEAAALKTRLFREYGTTMHGLMKEFNMDSNHFWILSMINLSDIAPIKSLIICLANCLVISILMTAAVMHAENILGAFGLQSHDLFLILLRPIMNQNQPPL